jgi:hypothetical protein
MVSPETQELMRRATRVYEEKLRAQLEQTHRGWFVAVEPESGDYFLSRSMYDAAMAARKAHPDRRPGILRVGHKVAVEIGNSPA